jgi:Flp pilus assembly CpaF family ATPase
MSHTPRITFKRGDNFKLDITVTDPSSDAAVAQKVILDLADVAVIDATALLAFITAIVPPVQQDIDDQQTILTTAIATAATEQGTYDALIVVDITLWTITSNLSWCGTVIEIMEYTLTNGPLGTFNIRAYEAATILWKPREHNLDILFTRAPEGGTSSETMIVDVQRGATNG